MSNYYEILTTLKSLPANEFEYLCKAIARGLGFNATKDFPLDELDYAFLDTITRESTDKLFRSEESWVIGFIRKDIDQLSLQKLSNKIGSAGIENFFFVVFGDFPEKHQDFIHGELQKLKINSAVFFGDLSNILISDYGKELLKTEFKVSVSIRALREFAINQAKDATWRTQFQTLSAIAAPTKITSVQGGDEADLFRAISKTGSFLLLGDPGGGKTTSLKVMAEQLSEKGGRTPVFLPLNQYTGNLLSNIGKALSETETLSPEFVKTLLTTGAFTIILDGVNEVQPAHLQFKIQDEINALTDPTAPTSRVQWIVSGRDYDYAISRNVVGMEFLDGNIWKIKPLSPDLIYQFLKDGLQDNEEALNVYRNLDSSIMEICMNPLMLNMLFAVYEKKKVVPSGRGKLYGQFIDLLLRWGNEINIENTLNSLSGYIGYKLDKEKYFELAFSVLTDLADRMVGISAAWDDVQSSFVRSLTPASEPIKVSEIIRKDLISRGILKFESRRISFFHHTFLEYFKALNLKGIPIDILIPTTGISGEKREQIVFLAGIVDSIANDLLSRVINVDDNLAYDIYRNAASPIDKSILLKLSKSMWNKTLYSDSQWIGANKSYALKFCNIAASLHMETDQLAKELFHSSNEKELTKNLLRFFQELGDVGEQRKLVKILEEDIEGIPDDYLFGMAVTAIKDRNYQKAIELLTNYIEKNRSNSAAYGNRANAYSALGKTDEARKDYEKAIKLDPNGPVTRTNFATFLKARNEINSAMEQLSEAIKDKKYAQAHYEYGLILEIKTPDEALPYFENAASLVIEPDDQERYTKKLVEHQEKHNLFGQAIRSYKRLIQLNPTSPYVRKWKESIANIRLQIDAIEKRRSTRDRLREKDNVLLGTLVKDFLSAAGMDVNIIAPQLFVTDGSKARLPNQLAVALLDTPQLDATNVRSAVDVVGDHLPFVNDVVLITNADTLDFDARIQLLTYRTSDKRVALITSLEAQEAFLRGDDACVELIDRSLRRITDMSDPFERRIPIKDRTEFFGRDIETQNIRALIQDQQPFGLFGIHKIGKSSLLIRVCQSLAAYSPDITVVTIELSVAFHTPSDIYKRILESLPQEIDVPKGDISTEKFRQKLIDYQKRMQAVRYGHRFLLLLDECAYLIPDRSSKGGLSDFLEFLGFLKAFRQEVDWFNFALCGRSPSISRTGQWKQGENPLIGFLNDKFLGPLTQIETSELIRSLGLIADLQFDDDVLEYIYNITGGHPQFTRILGSHIKSTIKHGNVTKQVVDDAVSKYLSNHSDRALLTKIYQESLDPDEKDIVKKLAVEKNLKRSDFLKNCIDDETKFRTGNAIDDLLDTTVIQQNDEMVLSHRYELFRKAIEQYVI